MKNASGDICVEYSESFGGDLSRVEGAAEAIQCNLRARAPSTAQLPESDPVSVTILGGSVKWDYLGPPAAIEDGTIEFINSCGSAAAAIEYSFSFAADGARFTLKGIKKFSPGRGSSAARQLCDIEVAITGIDGFKVEGTLSSEVCDLIDRYENCTVVGAGSGLEIKAGRNSFLALVNRRLKRTYPHSPDLLSADLGITDGLWHVLEFLTEVMLPADLPRSGPSIDDTVARIKTFLDNATISEAKTIKALLQIIGLFVPLFELILPEIRDVVRDILDTEADSIIRQALVGLHQIITLAYYSSPKADDLLGYARPRHQAEHHTSLPVTSEFPTGRKFDVVIAGTGPGGAVLADRLSAAGKSVLLLEAGAYIPEDRITNDEVDSISRLYKNSGLQAAIGPSSVTILQGACVGGGGVINNGIFFPLPAATLRVWQDAGFPFNSDDMAMAYAAIANDLKIGDIKEKALRLNPAGAFLLRSFGPAQVPPLTGTVPPGFYRTAVNFETYIGDGRRGGCLSTGLCNIGCGSERKVNTFQHYLANAMRAKPGDVVLLSEATVIRAETNRSKNRVMSFLVQTADGKTTNALGNEFVLCCGPVGSSAVLLRSADLLAAAPNLPVGQRFCGNIASPVFGFAESDVQGQSSVQMSQVYVPGTDEDGFLIETWFSPPGGLALAMPGFMDVHAQRMLSYSKLLSASPVIGTQAVGSVRLKNDSPVIDLPVTPYDLDRFRRGFIRLLDALLDNDPPVPALVRYGTGRLIKSQDDLRSFDVELRGLQPKDLFLLPTSTAHPQGGNAIGTGPDTSVIGADFKVHGIDNLRVCDGSIFPAVAGVNPQWTIMALAHLCAKTMNGEKN